MILIPALEIAASKVVLRDGEHLDVLTDDPLAAVRALRDRGGDFFQVRDLDALAGADPSPAVARLVEAGLPCAISAGVASMDAAQRWLATGVDRVLLDLDRFVADRLAADRDALAALGPRLGAELEADADDVVVRLEAARAAGIVRVQVRVRGDVARCVDRALTVTGLELFVETRIGSRDALTALLALGPRGLTGVVLADAYAALARAVA